MVPLLTGHLEIFPEGQLVAMDQEGMLLGYAASLIIYWDDYEMDSSWCDFTSRGTFKNHDPALGRTLYGAEVMVHPEIRGSGVGGKMYDARFELAKCFGILRIRAGARLRGYHKHAGRLTAQEYVQRVVRGSAARPDSLLPDQPRLPRARGGVGLPQEGP